MAEAANTVNPNNGGSAGSEVNAANANNSVRARLAILGRDLKTAMSRMFSHIRGQDDQQISQSAVLRGIESNITVNSTDAGPSGSILPRQHTIDAGHGNGKMPRLSWTLPQGKNVNYYAVVCEDLDCAVPGGVMHHGIFYNIPSARLTSTPVDVEKQDGLNRPRLTSTSWNFVSTHTGDSYVVPAPRRGSGTHRYAFNIVALTEKLSFARPHKLTKNQFQDAIVNKVLGWGQWIGVFERQT